MRTADTERAGRTSKLLYRRWLVASTAQRYSAAIQGLTVSLLVYALSSSTAVAGLVGTVRGVLSFLLTLVGGVVVDRCDRRRLMVLRSVVNVVVWSVCLLFFVNGQLALWGLVVVIGVDGVIDGLLGGATEAALRSLVAGDGYVRARAVNEGRDASAQLLGPPVAGALFGVWSFAPVVAAILLDAMCALASFLLPSLAPRRDVLDVGLERDRGRGLLMEALEGVRFFAGEAVLRTLMTITVLASVGSFLFVNAVQLALIGSGLPAHRVGLVATAEGVGVLIGAAVASWLVARVPTGRLVVGSLSLMALALVPVIVTPSYPVILLSAAVSALMAPALNAGLGGYLFLRVPAELQGRAGAASSLVVGVPAALTPAVAGVLVSVAGMAWTVVLATGLVLAGLGLSVGARSVRSIPLPEGWA